MNSELRVGLSVLFLWAGLITPQAQTTIPASLKAPPGSWNPAVQGFAVRTHQITSTRTPGDQNSIANVEKELNGGFGPGIAAPGPNSGYYFTDVLDFAGSPNSDGGQLFYNDLPFPGVDLDMASANYNPSNYVVEAITYLDLPAGVTFLGVRSDDSFRLTIGAGDNPLSYAALSPAGALFSGSRGPANNIFSINVTNAGVYPVRVVYGQGAGGANLEFWSTNTYFGEPVAMLINDPIYPDPLKSYVPATLPISAAKAYPRFLNPLPGDSNSQALPTITAELQDAGTTVVQSSVKLRLDGADRPATATKTGGVTAATYTPSGLLSPGAHNAEVIYQDNTGVWSTNTWTFSVPTFRFVAIPAGWAYPVGSRNAAEPGFAGLAKVVRTGGNFSSTVANGDANLAGTLIDPQTQSPFINLAANTTNDYFGSLLQQGVNWFGHLLTQPGGSFIEPGVINYATTPTGELPGANFGNTYVNYPDTNYPGVPGADDTDYSNYGNATGLAIEMRGFVHLPAGLQVIGVHGDDAVQLAFHGNDVRDLFRVSFAQNDANQGEQNYPVVLDVEQEGLFSFRVLQQRYINEANSGLELWTAPFTNQTQRTLVNAAQAVKVYRSVTVPTRPFVKNVTPVFGQTGVDETTTITATLANLGTNVPVMKVNGTVVTYTAATNGGGDVTLTYTPATPFARAALITTELAYGNTAATWSFVTKAIFKALYVAGGTGTQGDRINATRLASVHKADVTFVSDAQAASQGTNLAAGMDLVLFSSSALAGSNPINNSGFHALPIPIINWEQAYCDDLRMQDSGAGGGINNQSQVRIVGEGHPLAAGLINGDHVIATANYTFQQAPPPAEAIRIATQVGGTSGILWALTNGSTVTGSGGFTHPAKRAFIGWAGDSGSQWWNDKGNALFDAVIRWMLPAVALPPKLTISQSTGDNVTVSWTEQGVLEESTNLQPGSWTVSANQANPQSRPATGTLFFRIRQ